MITSVRIHGALSFRVGALAVSGDRVAANNTMCGCARGTRPIIS